MSAGSPPEDEAKKTPTVDYSLLSKLDPYEVIVATNEEALSGDQNLPLVAFLPDWRIDRDEVTKEPVVDPVTGQYKLSYMGYLLKMYIKLLNDAGMRVVILSPFEKVEDWQDKIDGFVIPGGRDIDPSNYGQDNTHSKFEKLDAQIRYNVCLNWIKDSDQKLPMFLICFGFQVINVIYGGGMNQQLDNAKDHLFKTRTFIPVEGTHLHKISGGHPITGNCFHHQNITEVADCLRVNCFDAEDGTPHGIEWHDDSRNVIGILWHPEAAIHFKDCDAPINLKIAEYFAKICLGYRQSKNPDSGL